MINLYGGLGYATEMGAVILSTILYSVVVDVIYNFAFIRCGILAVSVLFIVRKNAENIYHMS